MLTSSVPAATQRPLPSQSPPPDPPSQTLAHPQSARTPRPTGRMSQHSSANSLSALLTAAQAPAQAAPPTAGPLQAIVGQVGALMSTHSNLALLVLKHGRFVSKHGCTIGTAGRSLESYVWDLDSRNYDIKTRSMVWLALGKGV